MITIATSELKRFFDFAKPIKDSKLIPIYAYIKFECDGDTTTLTKTNGHSFIVCQVTAKFKKNITLLIDEKTLSTVALSKGETITIKQEGKNILITDGIRNSSSQNIEDNFPAIQPKTDEKITAISADVLEALFLAKNHTMGVQDKAMRPWMTYVHVTRIKGESYVIGANGVISYFKSFKEDLPAMCLDPDTIAAISRFTEVNYSRSGNYDYFDAGTMSYGFIMSESGVPDFTTLLDKFVYDKHFIVNRQDVIDFCEHCIRMNSSNVPPEVAVTTNGKKSILLTFTSMAGDQGSDQELACDKKNFDPDEFIFQPEKMIIALKDLGCEKIQFSHIPYHFLFTNAEDKKYIGAIMQIAKLQQPVVKK